MVSAPSSLCLLLLLLALLLCLRLLLCWLPLPLLWVCGSRVGLCSGGFSWVSLCLRFLGLPAFPFSLFPDLRFCPVPSPNPLGSAASASAHGLSEVQYTASSYASELLALFLSACSLVLLTSACCSFRYLFCTSLSTFGFSFCRSFRSSLVASVAVAPDPQARVPPSFPGSVCRASFLSWLRLSCLSPLVSFCCLLSSPGFWLFAVSSFSCALSVVLPAPASLLRSFLSPGSSGVALPSAPLFLLASLLPGGILEFSFAFSHYPVFCCSCGFAGFCLSCPPLFAGHVRSTSASLSLLLGLLFHGTALVGSSSQAMSESLSPARWLLVSSFWGFSSFRLCSFCRYAASSCVACSCRFSLLLSLLLVSLPCWRLLWFAPFRGLQCML